MKFLIEVRKTYIADSEKLREEFPDEYHEFYTEHPAASDRDWVDDCIAQGGLELATFQDSEITVDRW